MTEVTKWTIGSFWFKLPQRDKNEPLNQKGQNHETKPKQVDIILIRSESDTNSCKIYGYGKKGTFDLGDFLLFVLKEFLFSE